MKGWERVHRPTWRTFPRATRWDVIVTGPHACSRSSVAPAWSTVSALWLLITGCCAPGAVWRLVDLQTQMDLLLAGPGARKLERDAARSVLNDRLIWALCAHFWVLESGWGFFLICLDVSLHWLRIYYWKCKKIKTGWQVLGHYAKEDGASPAVEDKNKSRNTYQHTHTHTLWCKDSHPRAQYL